MTALILSIIFLFKWNQRGVKMKVTTDYPQHGFTREDLKNEINEGLLAIKDLQEICFTGQQQESVELIPSESLYIHQVFSNLYDYTIDGLLTKSGLCDDLHDAIAFTLTARINAELYSRGIPVCCETILNSLTARAKIDRSLQYETYEIDIFSDSLEYANTDDLTLTEVALLARMDEKSVRNATQPSKPGRLITYKPEGSGRVFVTPKEALSWLSARRSFVPTICDDLVSSPDEVLVPFASDGTFFGGHCEMRKGFKIGKKGNEEYIESIWVALQGLRNMQKTYWRRPNENGTPGIVSAAQWKVVSKAEFLEA